VTWGDGQWVEMQTEAGTSRHAPSSPPTHAINTPHLDRDLFLFVPCPSFAHLRSLPAHLLSFTHCHSFAAPACTPSPILHHLYTSKRPQHDSLSLLPVLFQPPSTMKPLAALLGLAATSVVAAPSDVHIHTLFDDSAPHQNDPNFISAVMRAHWYWRRLHCAQDLVWDDNLANAARADVSECTHMPEHVSLYCCLYVHLLTCKDAVRQQPVLAEARPLQLRPVDRVRTHCNPRLARGGDKVPLRPAPLRRCLGPLHPDGLAQHFARWLCLGQL
jgi:hypothetical protein